MSHLVVIAAARRAPARRTARRFGAHDAFSVTARVDRAMTTLNL
jgi:hypothetical protein|tara:strand:- start:1034 stop:1165 length:132 start_codon:yes stop_codon:yes gene_type:complete